MTGSRAERARQIDGRRLRRGVRDWGTGMLVAITRLSCAGRRQRVATSERGGSGDLRLYEGQLLAGARSAMAQRTT